MSENGERVNPVFLTDKKGIMGPAGEKYELDFNRESIKFAESKGFVLEDITRAPVTKMPELFYLAFRMHHRYIPKDKTDKFMEAAWDNTLPDNVFSQLSNLFNYAQMSNCITINAEEDEKNEFATVEI